MLDIRIIYISLPEANNTVNVIRQKVNIIPSFMPFSLQEMTSIKYTNIIIITISVAQLITI